MRCRTIARVTLAVFLTVAAGPAVPRDAPGTSEFRVNTTSRGFPTNSAVAQASAGDFVVVWTVLEDVVFPDGPFAIGLFGQRFDAAGSARGPEFRITDAVDYNHGAATAMDGEGNFVVVWHERGIHASRFAADGTVLAAETPLIDLGNLVFGSQPAVAGDAHGNWLAVWDGPDHVQGRRFDAAAEVWEPELQISSGTPDFVSQAAAAGNERGDLVAAWRQVRFSPESHEAIMARRLASTGEIRGEAFEVNETRPGNPRPAVDVDEQGGFAVAWSRGEDVLARRFDAAGTALGGEILVTSAADRDVGPALALDAAGDLLVAWLRRADGSLPSRRGRYQLMGRRFDALGAPRGGEFPLTALPPDFPVAPGLAANAPEGHVVTTFRAASELFARLLPATLRTGVLELADDPGAPFSEVAEEHENRDVHVLRTGGNGPLTVEHFTADGALSRPEAPAALAGEDYAAAAGTLVFAADEYVKTFPLEILEDDVHESNEHLTVGLRRPTEGALIQAPAAVEVVVYDDDPVRPGEGLAPLGPELRVNGSRAGEHRYPRTAANAGGDFLVVWQGREGGDGDWDVFGRLYGADGAARGPVLPLADDTAGDQERPAVAAAPDGSFVVTWIRDDLAAAGRRVTPAGAGAPSLGAELPLAVCGAELCDDLRAIDVSVDGAGRFVVVWNGDGYAYFDGVTYGNPFIESRRFSADGEPLGERFAAFARSGPAAVSAASSGEFMVVWNDYETARLQGRRWDAHGAQVGGPFTLAAPGASRPDLVRLPGDHVLAFWQSSEPAADPGARLFSSKSLDVYGRRFSPRGTPMGERFLLNGFRPGVQFEPRAAASPSGEHVVVWTSRDELGPGRSDVLARRFAADGRRRGGRVPVNPSPRPKSSPDVAVDAAGDFMVVWESDAGGGFDVFAQRFSGAACVAGQRALCLRRGRFRVEVDWRDFGGASGRAFARPLTDDTGVFWFFTEDNLEVIVKVLDGRTVNGHFWVFYGSLSNVEFEIAVTDAVSGRRKTYVNPLGHFASAGDVQAFPGN